MLLKWLLCLTLVCGVHGEDILCTSESCEEYKCSNIIPEECTIQNSTHSGIYLPYPGPCNCCDYCLRNLGLGEECTVGEPGMALPNSVCGDLLYCSASVSGSTAGTCEIVESECTDKQKEYDEKLESGELGHLEQREQCGRRGQYAHFKCVPGEICYCVSENGDRLFGEIPVTPLAEQVLNCECSRNHELISEFMGRNLHVGEFLRCQSNGDYDTVQCIGDECICVDAVDGVETYPDLTPVNITALSNNTLPCFNSENHLEGEYYRPCEVEYLELLELIDELEVDDIEVIGAVFPNCQLDGLYGPVQKNETHVYCSDPDGNVLENFILEKDHEGVETMNCACARSRSVSTIDLPSCSANGNYDPIQCRRGFCRCVDENGNQIKKEVHVSDRDSLDCSEVEGSSEVES